MHLTLQLLAQVSYLKAISASYVPAHVLRPGTGCMLCHGARHKSLRHSLDGWAAGALRPVARLVQPLCMYSWRDTRPSSRDLNTALSTTAGAVARTMRARAALVHGLPAAVAAANAAAAAAAAAVSNLSSFAGSTQQRKPQTAAAQPTSTSPTSAALPGDGPVQLEVHALTTFAWSSAVHPYAIEAATLLARAALPPGTDMTADDVAAVRMEAQHAARTAAQHAALLTTLPLWLVPGEAGHITGVLAHAASLLPMPAYGLAWGIAQDDEGQRQQVSVGSLSLHALAARCVDVLLSLQVAPPYVLLGAGPASCALAAAMACELEHVRHERAVVVLLDGSPVPPRVVLPDPLLYGLYEALRDAGALPGVPHPDAQGGLAPQPFGSFVADASRALAGASTILAAGGGAGLAFMQIPLAEELSSAGATAGQPHEVLALTSVDDTAVPALEHATMSLLRTRYTPLLRGAAEAEALERHVIRMLATCRWLRGALPAYAPDYLLGPAVLVLTEDDVGHVFLDAARESASVELSLVPLSGLLHGQVLNGAREQQLVVVAVVDGLMEMLAAL